MFDSSEFFRYKLQLYLQIKLRRFKPKLYYLLRLSLTPLYDLSIVPNREGYYLTKISTVECLICYDYSIWNGPFRDVRKHNHIAKIYQQSQINNLLYQQVKADLVNYFKNKHRESISDRKEK
ncbi:hypothetical protein RhiirA5_413995 [Rhizophagus irregularis]|uniref:Uncharacterized protein n=1 Tax=Rhizophagus irregularis TaxID=588596 RepID=A0A2N0PV68_9GLOM|nr:hypothetical protein RhiirA5_413995 [Rhizophagus irregularis]